MDRIKSTKGPNFKKKGRPSKINHENIKGLKDVGVENLHVDEEMAEKYTDGPDELPGENVHIRHINRNPNKTEIDKPAYS